jgi:hypothetical protein
MFKVTIFSTMYWNKHLDTGITWFGTGYGFNIPSLNVSLVSFGTTR